MHSGRRRTFPDGAVPLPAHLRYLIPNKFATSTDSIKHILVERTRRPAVLVPSLVLVTTRAVQDEELFLNYRLNPKLPAPEWYVSVDPEEDARLLAQAREAKERGNEHFKKDELPEALMCYSEAIELAPPTDADDLA